MIAFHRMRDPMTPEAFRAWRKRNELTQDQAGAVLEISRSIVQKYEAADAEIPKKVRLACAAHELGVRDYDGRPLKLGFIEGGTHG